MNKIACFAAAVIVLSPISANAEIPEGLASVRSERSLTIHGELSLGSTIARLGDLYNYPINIELSPQENELAEENKTYTVDVRQNETLASPLDRLLDGGDGMYVREDVHGQTVVRPSSIPTILDLVVDVEIIDASIWEALKAVAIAVNRHPNTDKLLEVAVPNTSPGTSHLVPAEFTDEKGITIPMGRATVRSLVGQIFSHSPLSLSYMYGEHPGRHVFMFKFLSGLRETEGQLRADFPDGFEEWWIQQRMEVMAAFERP